MYLNLRVERRRQCDERTLLWDVRVEKTTNPMFLVLAPHSGSFVTLIAWHRVPWIPSSLTIESVINETATNGLARKVTREKRLSARNAFLMSPLMQLLHYHDYNKILNGSFFMWNYVFFLFFIVRPWRFIVALVWDQPCTIRAPLCKFDSNAIRDLHFGSVGYRGRMMMMTVHPMESERNSDRA